MNLPGTSSARVALIPFAAAVLLLTATSTRVDAIRFGALDGNAHPYVGLAVFDDAAGNPMWRCTGTLLSPTIFLTAGHCTDGAAGATIWFESEVLRGDPAFNYPFGGPTSVEGTPHTHPQFNPSAFFLFDLGVVVLHTPVVLAQYGQLPPLGLFDPLFTQRRQQNQEFTPVGYGLQFTNPAPDPGRPDAVSRFGQDHHRRQSVRRAEPLRHRRRVGTLHQQRLGWGHLLR
jgi:hypothetical protein